MKYHLIWLLVAGLLLHGERPGWGLVCATRAARPVQQGDAVRGELHALVVYARFEDEDAGQTAAPAFAHQFFDPERPGSLTHFYLEMSRGQYRLTGETLPRWYTSDRPASAYMERSGDYGGFVREILRAVDADVDLGQYDNDGPDGIPNSGDDDGDVDFIFVNTLTVPEGFIIGSATGIARLGLGGGYTTNDRANRGGFIRVRSDADFDRGTGGVLQRGHTFELAVGSMAHEYGHVLGLPDLFDTEFAQEGAEEVAPEDDSAGIGYWGLMGHGVRGWNEVDGPNPFCVWSLEQLGWIGVENENLVVVEEDLEDVVFEDVSAGGKVYKLPTGNPESYFLVEHRRPGTSYYERNLPAGGLLIWKIDQAQAANNSEANKQVDLVAADGLFLDAGYPQGRSAHPDFGRDNLDFWAHDTEYSTAHGGNLGDATDVWDGVIATEFWVVSNPAALSGINVANIRRQGDSMVADLRIDDRRRAGPGLKEEVWKNTIEMVGDVVVPPGGRLTIAPGTRVIVGEDLRRSGRDPQRSELVVQGECTIGSATAIHSDAVLFTSAAANPRPGDWYGIVVDLGGQVIMRRAEIEYARDGLSGERLQNNQFLDKVAIRQVSHCGIRFADVRDFVTLTRLEVSQAGSTGVWIGGPGRAQIRAGLFSNNGRSGLERIGGFVECTHSEFIDNGSARDEGANLILGRSVSGRVVQNRFFRGVGIRCIDSEDVVIENNQLEDHRIGLVSSSARPRISSNEFTRNELALQISGFSVPDHLVLNIVQETPQLLDNQAIIEVVARNNWWGRVDEGWIEERMSGEVEWRPFLNFDPRLPVDFSLSQNYPNPFNGSTVIDYSVGIEVPVVAGEADMVLEVRTITGGLVRRLVQKPAAPGFFSVVWDGRNKAGKPAASGVYYYQLKVGPITRSKRLLLLK